MDLQEYQQSALRTESVVSRLNFNKGYVMTLLQLFAVNGQILDALKKEVYYGNSKKTEETVVENLNKMATLVNNAAQSFSLRDYRTDVDVNPRFFHGCIGIATEAGELIELLLSNLEGKPIDVTNLHEELNDGNWYQAILNDAFNLNWEEGLERNIAKLKKRYPEKFTTENAENRNLEVERQTLEGK